MKKIVLFLVLILMIITISAKNNGSYYIKCYKCNDVNGCPRCNAWRMYSEESDKTIDGHKVMVYHCAHGHVLYLSQDSDDRW